MQLITNLSKLFVIIILSCSALFFWYDKGPDLIGFVTYHEDNNTTFGKDEDDIATQSTIWSSISDDFTLDRKVNTVPVQTEIRRLLQDQNQLYQILEAAEPYIYYIHHQTKLRGLPAELALIPAIESEFNPNDHSKKGALGLWQLMSGTASELGMKVKSGYDERRNILASTKAALAYFNDLGMLFKGDWYLAIAAYNCGQGKIKSALKRAKNADFWHLSSLPRETKDYVPKLLAVAEIIKNPSKYGITLPPIANEPYFTVLTTKKPVSLKNLAQTAGVNIKTLNTLNPDYKKGKPIVKKGMRTLLVPISNSKLITAQLSEKIQNSNNNFRSIDFKA